MCTLSFIPTDQGYVVAMNRDEQHVRIHAHPPAIVRDAIYPQEPVTGGTWLAVNSQGLTLAVLNRNEDGPLPAKLRSRGELIPALVTSASLAEVHRRLVEIGFKGMWPFRLVAISAEERELCEWAWGTQLIRSNYEWHQRHWYSSGMSDAEAQRFRSAVVDQWWQQPNAGSLPWLRALHKSHEPRQGAFSICVHRDDAATVSYSEIVFEKGVASYKYAGGSPCQSAGFDSELCLPAPLAAHITS